MWYRRYEMGMTLTSKKYRLANNAVTNLATRQIQNFT
jgi:hypothetical protein